MSIENLDRIFKPKSIAVVGASERKGSVGAALMQNLIERGFPGDIYPINPRHKKVWRKPAVASIAELDTRVDLALIALPIASAPQVVSECAEAGVGGAVIISSGGKEIGEKGRAIEAAIRKEARDSKLRIIGPNCVGVIATQSKLNASFANQMPLAGKMAFISQSGAICTAVLDLSIKENIGFSYFVSLGDMLDVDFGDMIDFLGGQGDVSSIVMYVESLSRFRKFMSAARAVSRVKPIIALKAGRTRAGALAAASHTGAMAGEDSVYDAAFRRAGILRVKTFEELLDCAELLSKQPRPKKPGLAIITNAGGPGVMAADTLADYGCDPVPLSDETMGKLNAILPPHWSRRNPIDMLGESTPETYCQAVDICIQAEEVDGILIMSAPQALTDTAAVAASLIDLIKDKPLPIFTSWVGGPDMRRGDEIFNQAGIPTFDTPERAVRAFMDLYRYSENIEMLQQIPSRLSRRLEFDRDAGRQMVENALRQSHLQLTEAESKSLLAAYGIPVNPVKRAATIEAAVQHACDTGFPVVLKIDSRDITHKSDAGGVFLHLADEYAVRRAFNKAVENAKVYCPEARIEGVTIQPMASSADYELILGIKKDRDFGPVILFGMGGVFTEVLEDHAIAFPPLNRLLAHKLIEQTRVCRLLKGYRNSPPADMNALEEILIRLAQLATDFSEIEELDINPLMVTPQGQLAVDARVLLKPSLTPAPLHLSISPYPAQYETNVRTDTGTDIFVRPIRPEDAPLLSALLSSFSPRSIYMRFFTPLKHFPHRMLARFTQIDYDREIALVAFNRSDPDEKLLGVGRVITERNQKNAEFAVMVSDAWQGKGIGAALLKRCLAIAAEHHIEKVWGTVLSENVQMLALGRKLGFNIKRSPDAGEYELSMRLSG